MVHKKTHQGQQGLPVERNVPRAGVGNTRTRVMYVVTK